MVTQSKSFKENLEQLATTRYQKETKLILVDKELSAYPYCRLPEHYFDLLLYKKYQSYKNNQYSGQSAGA